MNEEFKKCLNDLINKFFNFIISIIDDGKVKDEIEKKYESYKDNFFINYAFLLSLNKDMIEKMLNKYNITNEEHKNKINEFYELFLLLKN